MTYASEVTADAPIHWLRLGEASGATAADASGNGRTGTYTNVTYGTTGLQSGDTDKAVTLNGTTAYVTVPAGAWKAVGNALTIELLCKPTAGDGTARTLLDGDNTSPGQWGIQIGTGNKLNYMLNAAGSAAFQVGAATILAGMAVHVAMTYDGTTWKCYAGGGLDYIQTVVGSWPAGQATAPWTIGASRSTTDTYAGFWPGVVDEFAFYNKVLTPDRIAVHAKQAAQAVSQARLDAEYVETLVLPDNAARRLDALYVESLILPDAAQRRLDALFVEVLHPTTPASPVPLGIVAVGTPTTPVRIKHDDGVWRVIRPRSQQ